MAVVVAGFKVASREDEALAEALPLPLALPLALLESGARGEKEWGESGASWGGGGGGGTTPRPPPPPPPPPPSHLHNSASPIALIGGGGRCIDRCFLLFVVFFFCVFVLEWGTHRG